MGKPDGNDYVLINLLNRGNIRDKLKMLSLLKKITMAEYATQILEAEIEKNKAMLPKN